jgi:ParB-like chromosome segregation protein Spo0J
MEWIEISKLRTHPKNPRAIRDSKFEKLKQSIIEFPEMLVKRPLIAYTHKNHYIVLGGNQRLRAMQEIGIEEVPVILADEWSEEQRNRFLIADNINAGEWNWDSLANEWDADKLSAWGLDIPSEPEESDKDFCPTCGK